SNDPSDLPDEELTEHGVTLDCERLKCVALTFDDGPGEHTDRLLEMLADYDAHATTNVDRTNYYATVPTAALDMALWMESDRMGHFLGGIDQAELDEQTGVVINEKHQRGNQPYGEVWRRIPASTYPAGHPYSWPTIGSEEDLKASTLEDVRAWFMKYYGPTNATLVLSGDIE